MKKLIKPSITLLVLGFSIILEPGCRDAGTPSNTDLRNYVSKANLKAWRIDSLLRSHFADDGPGVAMAAEVDSTNVHDTLTGKYSLARYTFETGLSDITGKEKVTSHSVFNIGSLTKQFTARAILATAGFKRMSLSDPIGYYLKGLQPRIAALEISQLLSHCSGIPDHYGYTDTNKVKHATNHDVLKAIQNIDTLYFPAGSHYKYSNTAYCLLGVLLEKLSGLPYSEAVKKTGNIRWENGITDLHSLSFLPASSVIGNRVHGYDQDKSGKWVEADAPESIFFTTEADGGALISMNDYILWCHYLEMYYNKGLSLPEFQPHTLVDTAAGLYYGYGWFVLPRRSKDGPLIYHTGFNGGFRTTVLLIPAINYRIAIFSASPGVDLEDLVHQINLILGIDDKGFIKSGPLES